MAKKTISWKTKGMNRDISVSSFNPEFAFENVNLRLATNEGNTMLSWVNEKGPAKITLYINTTPWESSTYELGAIEGTVIGTAVIDHKLVLFTHEINAEDTTILTDRIYVFEYHDSAKTEMYGKVLYKGNLGFSLDNPLETMVSYESDYIEKVYWTDGLNQPRLINIKATIEKLKKWNAQVIEGSSKFTLDHFFDFVPTFDSDVIVTITKDTSASGTFAPGVIQYCFTYVNKYSQQTNIVYTSSLYYLSYSDRGASPTEKVSSSFRIEISNVDSNFDYIRLYSIQRTSLNDTPIVKLLDDIPVVEQAALYIDNGTTGSTMDPTELLYVGGREISALTMASKDNTLFLGNIKQKNILISSIQKYFNDDRQKEEEEKDVQLEFKVDSSKQLSLGKSDSVYFYKNALADNLRKISTFKGGEWYRFGMQLQKKDGEWTEPIWIDDKENTHYPGSSVSNDMVNLAYAQATINLTTIASKYVSDISFYDTFVKARPVIVYPNINDKTVLCQGVLNPTVFNIEDRIDKVPYAQASWFFRPNNDGAESSSSKEGVETTATINSNVSSVTDAELAQTDSYFSSSTDYFVLVADVDKTNADEIVSAKGLTRSWTDSSGSHSETVQIRGIIYLTGNDSRCTYAFFSRYPLWKYSSKGSSSSTSKIVMTYKSSKGYPLYNVGFSSGIFKLYSNLKVNNQNYFYYGDTATTLPQSYTLKFYTDGNDVTESTASPHTISCLYTVIFKHVSDNSSTDVYVNTGGSILRFKHYDSLYTDDEANTTDTNKQVEIQGSLNVYDHPYEDTVSNPKTNTQFFIDQSIVTLNSPDLEFDTDVQTYGTENLYLRVIGAIPLTSTASSHVIKASSSMLPTGYDSSSESTVSVLDRTFGIGERDINVVTSNLYLSSYKRLVSGYIWNDADVTVTVEDSDTIVKTEDAAVDYVVYPWQRSGPLNNDARAIADASSYLQYKREANMWFSGNTEYFSNAGNANPVEFSSIGVQIPLTENAEIMNYRLPKQRSGMSEINYYPNIDKVLVNSEGYIIKHVYDGNSDNVEATDPISIKYKSTTHAVIALNAVDSGKIPILPYSTGTTNSKGESIDIGKYESKGYGSTFWGDTTGSDAAGDFTQSSVNFSTIFGGNNYGYLWLGEICKTPTNRFGGNTTTALLNNKWVPAGDDIEFDSSTSSITLKWTEGDTFYQRYDCLKTYPYTEDDSNQIIEILSFMCETHVNIDGRYDRNRGQLNNTNVRPTNFNLLNSVYSQKNNFFTSRKIDVVKEDELKYPNQIFYTKTKESGARVDLWTNVTLASVLELDGDKGPLNSLRRFNDQLIAFQDSGISQILYNENVQLTTTQGVPIELANSGKVQGKRYISNTIGCSNKWAMAQTPTGIYFIDNNDKGIYLFNGQLANLSVTKGFNAWCKQNLPSSETDWNPNTYSNFVAYYDKLNQDVLFIGSSNMDFSKALAFSEKFGCFTSFYDYGNATYFENLDDTGVWVKGNELWKHQSGDYCDFFNASKPFSMTLVGNQEPTLDKIFTNMEFRACVEGEGTYDEETEKFIPTLPFNSLEAWDEYQHGKLTLSLRESMSSKVKASLERKFRLWRCDIPRDNVAIPTIPEDTTGMTENEIKTITEEVENFKEDEAKKGIKRFKARPLDRMRNPWVYLKLEKDAAEDGSLSKTEIHDIMATYFG